MLSDDVPSCAAEVPSARGNVAMQRMCELKRAFVTRPIARDIALALLLQNRGEGAEASHLLLGEIATLRGN